MALPDRNPRRLEDFRQEIAELEQSVEGLGHRVAEAHSERSLLGFQAEWHIRGILYHLRRLFDLYAVFVHEVCARAAPDASVLIMYAPSFQEMLFEFYALVNLSRISLDSLRIFLSPVFKRNCDRLPKSIRDVLMGKTDCPVYNALSGQDALEYLLDLRNCLVHYRSFATSDNAYVIEEGFDTSDIDGQYDAYFVAMARADFRRIDDKAIAVNILLPDSIFEISATGGKSLTPFTYEQRWSLLSMARSFAQLAVTSLRGALQCLEEINDPVFTFTGKRKTAQQNKSSKR
jgi:hypothetical protein